MDNRRKPVLYYWLMALIIISVINMFFLPLMSKNAVEKVNYDVFLTEMHNKNISRAEVNEDVIYFFLKEDGEEAKEEPTNTNILPGAEQTESADKKVYSTVRMEDDRLVERLYEAGASFGEVKPKEISPWLSTLIMFVVFLLLWRFVMSRMMKKMGGGMGGNAMAFGKANAKVYVKAQTGKTFADVAGQDEAKEALTEIVDFLHNPAKYTEVGATMPKGALLVGPPGTGKTLLAQAVAGEAEVPFFSISGSEFVEMFVGMGAAKVRDLFKQANEKAPCIVFIDEIDTIGKKRDGGGIGGNDEREQTLNQLLTEMDGFDGKKGVVILAATNRPETLDKALLRPGRFDRRIPVELPDLPGREAILKVHSAKIKMEDDIDFNAVARATSGASGAELANIINEGALRAVRMGRTKVSQSDLEESVEVILAGYQRKGAVISRHEKEIIAFHEVGHALVAAKQKNSAPVHKITIIPRTSGALGYTMQIDEGEHFLMNKEEAFNKIATLTGGRVAEELKFHSITTGASNDIEQATKIARAMITRYGMSDEFGMVALETVSNQYLGGDASLACSDDTATKIDAGVIALVRKAHDKAASIIGENMDKLEEIAGYLLERETITGEEFMDILTGKESAEEKLAALRKKKTEPPKPPKPKKERPSYLPAKEKQDELSFLPESLRHAEPQEKQEQKEKKEPPVSPEKEEQDKFPFLHSESLKEEKPAQPQEEKKEEKKAEDDLSFLPENMKQVKLKERGTKPPKTAVERPSYLPAKHRDDDLSFLPENLRKPKNGGAEEKKNGEPRDPFAE